MAEALLVATEGELQAVRVEPQEIQAILEQRQLEKIRKRGVAAAAAAAVDLVSPTVAVLAVQAKSYLSILALSSRVQRVS